MRPTLKRPSRRAPHQRGGDDGLVIILVALLLVIFLIITAIVVDLGNARQQKRQAVAAADAGALAGAQALGVSTQTPAGCTDASCAAAFYTLASVDLSPGNVGTFASGRGSCTQE